MLATASAHNFRFDTVQMPLNVITTSLPELEQKVLPVLVRQEMTVSPGMKPLGSGIRKVSLLAKRMLTPVDCLHYAMSLPTSLVITHCRH